jgi:glutaredoxin
VEQADFGITSSGSCANQQEYYIIYLQGGETMARRLVAYISPWCYNCSDTRAALQSWGVPAEFVNIEKDAAAARRVIAWTGFRSVPTLLIAEEGSLEPCEAPAALAPGASPHGVDRGSMLTEPTRAQLRSWLIAHSLLKPEAAGGSLR